MSRPIGSIEETVVHASEPTQDEGLLSSLGLDGSIFLSQLLNFLVVSVIVWYLILKPLTKKMEERKKIIDESMDKAKEIETMLTLSQQKYQEKIDEAKVEANKIFEHTHEEAEQLSIRIKEKAKKDIELLTTQAKRNIDIERQEAMDAVRKETAHLVVSALEKILDEKIDEKVDRKLIEMALKKI